MSYRGTIHLELIQTGRMGDNENARCNVPWGWGGCMVVAGRRLYYEIATLEMMCWVNRQSMGHTTNDVKTMMGLVVVMVVAKYRSLLTGFPYGGTMENRFPLDAIGLGGLDNN